MKLLCPRCNLRLTGWVSARIVTGSYAPIVSRLQPTIVTLMTRKPLDPIFSLKLSLEATRSFSAR